MKEIYYPEDKLPLTRIIPMGIQHVVAMFGATVLAPILMGFNPQVAIFFSGIGTLTFIFITGFKIPSYLGSSFAFIGPVLAVTAYNPSKTPDALFGISCAAVLYAIAAVITMRFGSHWIEKFMPPIVTGTVVAIIGLNLSSSAVMNFINSDFTITTKADIIKTGTAIITFLAAAAVSLYFKGFLRLIPILSGVIIGYFFSFFAGIIEPDKIENIKNAAWFGLPPFQAPNFSIEAALIIAPVFIVLIAENKGHIEAISGYLKRDLSPYLGRAYLGDAIASFISSLGGGTPQTTYAENMGVMAITKVFSVYNFIAASIIAIILGLCPKFGAVIQSIPSPVLGGVTIILYGLITLMGVKIWQDAKIDFCLHKNLIIAGSTIIFSTGLGIKGVTIGNINIAGIAFGTIFAILLNILLGGKEKKDTKIQDHKTCPI